MPAAQERTYRPKMRTEEAARYCGSTRSTFEKLRLSGSGAQYFVIGRTVVYDPDDLDAWMNGRRRKSTSVAA